MADQDEHYERSWVLYHILDKTIGSQEMVDIRRRLRLMSEYVINGTLCSGTYSNYTHFCTGSLAEGFSLTGSDFDNMFINNDVAVWGSNQDTNSLSDRRDMTVFIMRNAVCRPCYVTLELVQVGQWCNPFMIESIVQVGDLRFISSEMYEKLYQDIMIAGFNIEFETHGPAACLKNKQSNLGIDVDVVWCFHCASWPPEASEWLRRHRLFGWPDKALIHNISQSGCHVVPVGDKTSGDAFLQWRISFATAERKLIHSLCHDQFLVYGLLKIFLKQISGELEEMIGDVDILSSYIMKTVVLFAVENTPLSFWTEQNAFLCFMYCIRTLITWINAGYCPNYFIVGNNMFHGKVHGENQQKLLRFFSDIYDMKWMCLFVGTSLQLSFGERIESVLNGEWEGILLSPEETEYEHDINIFQPRHLECAAHCSRQLTLLCKSNSDMDEFIAYRQTVTSVSFKRLETYGKHITARGNKEKYKSLRKCRNFLIPHASVNTSPGQLVLATYHYHTGNYTKALELCGNMISTFKIYVNGDSVGKDKDRYKHLYCGRGYPLLKKYQEVVTSDVIFLGQVGEFCPYQLDEELACVGIVQIPPLPYALFLSFLCYRELGDTRRRDTTLIHLRAVKIDEHQGGASHWIVHNLLGICYETIGDIPRAIRAYRDSLRGGKCMQQWNPAKDKIERLQHLPI